MSDSPTVSERASEFVGEAVSVPISRTPDPRQAALMQQAAQMAMAQSAYSLDDFIGGSHRQTPKQKNDAESQRRETEQRERHLRFRKLNINGLTDEDEYLDY